MNTIRVEESDESSVIAVYLNEKKLRMGLEGVIIPNRSVGTVLVEELPFCVPFTNEMETVTTTNPKSHCRFIVRRIKPSIVEVEFIDIIAQLVDNHELRMEPLFDALLKGKILRGLLRYKPYIEIIDQRWGAISQDMKTIVLQYKYAMEAREFWQAVMSARRFQRELGKLHQTAKKKLVTHAGSRAL